MPRTPPAPRSAYRAWTELPTRWADNDQYGHMNNAVHYVLFDTAVSAWEMRNGILDDKGGQSRNVVVENGCRYHAEAGYPDTVHVGIAVSHIGTSSWRYEIGLFRNDEPQAFAEGFFAQVRVDPGTSRPAPLPEEVRSRLEAIRQPAAR